MRKGKSSLLPSPLNTSMHFFLFQLSDTVEAVKSALETEKELADKSQKELEDDLTKSKHRYQSIY